MKPRGEGIKKAGGDDLAEARRLIPISADWVLKRIKEGKRIRLKNAKIDGDIDLCKLDLPIESSTGCKIVSSKIRIDHSEFRHDLIFFNCFFNLDVRFSSVIFNKVVMFDNSIFSEESRFSNATFNEHAGFCNVTFNKDVRFDNATFNTNAIFNNATFGGSANFNRANIALAQFDYANFRGNAIFNSATFDGYAGFVNTTFNKGVRFDSATFCFDTNFVETTFSEYAGFDETTFRGPNANFDRATFEKDTSFVNATFGMHAAFVNATFRGHTNFFGAAFRGDIRFIGTAFKKNAGFNGTKFEGDVLTFRDAKFTLARSQENACRRAKIILAKAGNREEEEYHFFREMEAKRKQKGIYDTSYSHPKTYQTLRAENLTVIWRLLWYDFIEHIFIQKMFGYGVHPKRLMISWAAIVLAFGMLYWYGKGLTGDQGGWDYFKVSFATAIAPGFIGAIINQGSEGYRLVPTYHFAAMVETIVGTFLWAGFIATFAKKYMR